MKDLKSYSKKSATITRADLEWLEQLKSDCQKFALSLPCFIPKSYVFFLYSSIIHMGVSINGGTPKSSIYNRVFHYKPSILGYHH